VLPLVISIPLAGLKQGDNTFELTSANGNGGYPPEVANIALSIGATGGATGIASGRAIHGSGASDNLPLLSATNKSGIIGLKARVSGRVAVYNSAGALLETFIAHAGETQLYRARFSPGILFVRFSALNTRQIESLIVR
jgi:hypothetical protein